MKNYGEMIKERRIEKGLTQEELAAKCNLTGAYISYIEREEKTPSEATIRIIAMTLEMDVERILDAYYATKRNHALDRIRLEFDLRGRLRKIRDDSIPVPLVEEWMRQPMVETYVKYILGRDVSALTPEQKAVLYSAYKNATEILDELDGQSNMQQSVKNQ